MNEHFAPCGSQKTSLKCRFSTCWMHCIHVPAVEGIPPDGVHRSEGVNEKPILWDDGQSYCLISQTSAT